MEALHVELLVVLAPALACTVLCVAANASALQALFADWVMRPLLQVLACREHVNTIIGVTTNIMFIGPAVGVLYGSSGETLLDQRLGILVGLFCGVLFVRLSRHAAVLANNEAGAQLHAARIAARESLRTEQRARAAAARRPRRGRHQ